MGSPYDGDRFGTCSAGSGSVCGIDGLSKRNLMACLCPEGILLQTERNGGGILTRLVRPADRKGIFLFGQRRNGSVHRSFIDRDPVFRKRDHAVKGAGICEQVLIADHYFIC